VLRRNRLRRRLSGEQEFFLSCRTAGKLLGVDHSTAACYLFLLAHDGILEPVEKADRARRRATRYRYRAD
jgi:Fic family protein